MLFLLMLSLASAAPSMGGSEAYVGRLSAEAARKLREIASRDPVGLKGKELADWAEARLAWIALYRLQGQEAEALKVFEGCRDLCGKYGPSREWEAQKAWGCQKKREAIPCLSKTKAQKPPR